jgi:hypothetical protein
MTGNDIAGLWQRPRTGVVTDAVNSDDDVGVFLRAHHLVEQAAEQTCKCLTTNLHVLHIRVCSSLASHIHARAMTKVLRTAAVAIRVRPPIKAEIERFAAARNQSLTSLMELALIQFIEREGKRKRGSHAS